IEMEDIEKAAYERVVSSFKAGLIQKIKQHNAENKNMEILEAILRLRQLACHPALVPQLFPEGQIACSSKFNQVLEDLETLFQEKKKVVLFSQFTSLLELFKKEALTRGWNFSSLDGSTKNRQEVVDRFQQDEENWLLLLSLKAGGVGLNLTRADFVLLYDPWWNEAVEKQAIDRAHRIGRKETLFIKRYITQGTIEENILELKKKKGALVDSIMEESNLASHISIDELQQLLS
ncbi:MAG TPA: C-terminal helicase domain-containing protein, partial [Chlamydiales bacterium]|nr:C-terminal helicase domain-containing protein [Chlamydiales bacterium]